VTELIWDGKYQNGEKQQPMRIALPFQTVETVVESAQESRSSVELFATGEDAIWRNRLIWGDKKYVLPSLLAELAGKVNLIYVNPPFETGPDFSFATTLPQSSDEFTKEPSALEHKAYRDIWGVAYKEHKRGATSLDKYLQWLSDTVILLRDLLSDTGSIYVHPDLRVTHYAKSVLDEVFGIENFRNEIIWKTTNAHNDAKCYGSTHQNVYFYTKSDSWTWNTQFDEFSHENIDNNYRNQDESGRHYASSDLAQAGPEPGLARVFRGKLLYPPSGSHWRLSQKQIDESIESGRIFFTDNGIPQYKRYLDEMPGAPSQSIWLDRDVPHVRSAEGVGRGTQRSEAFLNRIISASSKEGDIVLDCFVGSGAAVVVAEKLHRRWLACDFSRFAIRTTRKRLLAIPHLTPFSVQNLGKYERQAWETAEVSGNRKNHPEGQREHEAAYRQFILELYHANSMAGHTWLHGTKSGRIVHVAPADAHVTQADVKAIVREVRKAMGAAKDTRTRAGVDILGWEFASEVTELSKQLAVNSCVDVSLKKIPLDVLDKCVVEQGDVKFFELGALRVDLKRTACKVMLKLSDFVIPAKDIPEEVCKDINHWSQLVDYWAVDWDFRSDTFHDQWQAYRTRKDQEIQLATNYEYKEPGEYRIAVKVIDILGNDTTKTLGVSLKRLTGRPRRS
jgi:adenine-specific DNA-methyltransferase